MNPAFAFEDLSDSFQFDVPPRRQTPGFAVVFPLVQVFTRRREPISKKRPNAHARLRKASREALAPVGLLYVFTQSEFDPARSGLEYQLLGPGAVTQLDHTILSANRIGRAVQQI